jgi:hypothetical protein
LGHGASQGRIARHLAHLLVPKLEIALGERIKVGAVGRWLAGHG